MKRMLLAGAILLALISSASAASRVWISEFAAIGSSNNNVALQVGTLPTITNQSTLDISGGVQSSAAFNAQTQYIRIMCEVQCAVKSGGTASTSDMLMPALSAEYFGVQGGSTISVIAAP